jgi:hypothetical protein
MVLVHKFPEQNIYLAYVFGGGLPEQEIKARIATDLQTIGGRVTEYVHYQEWPNYFPHFDATSLKAGILDDLEQLQGRHHTTYVGEWATFGMLPRVVEQSASAIQKLLTGNSP